MCQKAAKLWLIPINTCQRFWKNIYSYWWYDFLCWFHCRLTLLLTFVSSWKTSKIQIFGLQQSFYSKCISPEGVSPLYAGVTLRSISKSSRRVGRVTHALKEARLQSPVLTNRNGIWGYRTRISKHTFATSEEHQNRSVVDAAGIGWREKLLPGEVLE